MSMLAGGVSLNGCIYNKDEEQIIIRGWLYPASEYDRIQVVYNNTTVGDAELRVQRIDVYKNYPNKDGMESGFFLKASLRDFNEKDDNILLLIWKDKVIVEHRIIKIVVNTFSNKLINCVRTKKLCPDIHLQTDRDTVWIDTDNEVLHYKQENFLKEILKGNITYENIESDWEIPKETDKLYIVSGSKWYEICEAFKKAGRHRVLKDYVPVWYYYFLQDNIVNVDVIINDMKDDISLYLNFLSNIKKLCTVYGNCQALKITKILGNQKDFASKYYMLSIPPVFRISNKWMILIRKVFGFLDLLVYQHISWENKFNVVLSSDYMLSACKENCQKICIPNMYFTGYFLQFCKNEYEYVYKNNDVGHYGDRNINEIYSNGGKDSLKLVNSFIDNKLYENKYSKDDCDKMVAVSLNNLREREKCCDIIISDFIEKNYKKIHLFYAVDHPSNDMYLEMIKRILKYIGFENVCVNMDEVQPQNGIEIPIYPSVYKNLELEFEKSLYNFNTLIGEGKFSIQDWLRTYVKYMFTERKV